MTTKTITPIMPRASPLPGPLSSTDTLRADMTSA